MPAVAANNAGAQQKESTQSAAPSPKTTGNVTGEIPQGTNRAELRQALLKNAPVSSLQTNSSSLTNGSFEATTISALKQHTQLESIAGQTSNIRSGQARMQGELTHEVREHEASWGKLNPWSSRFYEGGLIAEKRKEIVAIGNFITGLTEHENKIRLSLTTSRTLLSSSTDIYRESVTLRQEADKVLERARELGKQNKEQEAQREVEKARELTIRSLERLQEAQRTQRESILALPPVEKISSLPPAAVARYAQHLKETTERLSTISEGLKETEAYIRMARNTTIIVGATVATGGLATSGLVATYGVVGAATITIGGGAAAGTAIGVVATTAEQGRALHEGQKTGQKALSDGLVQAGQDAQTSLTTSVATYSSIASIGKFFPTLSKAFGGSRTAQAAAQLLAGGAGSVPATLLQEGLDVTANGKELSGVLDLGGKLFKNGLANGFGNMIGMFGNLARSSSTIRNVAVTGGEIVADTTASVAIEAADAKVRGREFSVRDAWDTANQTIIGNITGEVSSAVRARTTPGTNHATSLAVPKNLREGNHNAAPDNNIAARISGLSETYAGDGVRVHPMGKIVFVKDADTLKGLYDKAGGPPLDNTKVAAFFDKKNDVMVVPEFDHSSKEANVIQLSMIMHEHKHQQGLGEAEAYRAQAEYLKNHGLHLSFNEVGPVITRTAIDGTTADKFNEQLNSFISTTYRGVDQRVAATIKPDAVVHKGDTKIAEALKILPDSPERSEIDALVSQGKLQEAIRRIESIKTATEARFYTAQDGKGEEVLVLFDKYSALADALNERVADHKWHIPQREVRVESINRNSNSKKDLKEFLGALHTETEKERFKVLAQDLQVSGTVDDLKALNYTRANKATDIRSIYQNTERFQRFESANGRTVMKLEINGADRIIIGFDGASRSNEILFAGNPHLKDLTYKPEVLSKISRFLKGG